MATRKNRLALRQLRTLLNQGAVRESTDGQLLERFVTGRGETAELAFAALVERHGAMVLRVCRAQLADPHDTLDAYQATFLVLVEKARTLWVRDSIGPWLHQVAYRTARCARSSAARRRKHERRAAEMATVLDARGVDPGPSWEQVLHREIDRLPARYRVPIVLRDLQGLTCEEAARRMGRPVGTVKSWRSRARDRLRDRLTRSGLALSASGVARAACPPPGAEELARTAVHMLSGSPTAGAVPASVRALIQGVAKAMFISRLRTMAGILFALTVLAAALGVAAQDPPGDPKGTTNEAAPAPAGVPRAVDDLSEDPREDQPPWSLSLRDAIRIGLAHAKGVRLVSPSTRGNADDLVIAPVEDDGDIQGFRAAVAARVGAIGEQYWGLARHRERLWSSNRAVELAEEVLRREQSWRETGRGNASEVAACRRRLEQFRFERVNRTSEAIGAERRFRGTLGLPTDDDRRIVPATPPVEVKISPDWDECRANMLEKHPGIIRAKAGLKGAEAASSDANSEEMTKRSPLAPDRPAAAGPYVRSPGPRPARLERHSPFEQVIHQALHTLARHFVEVDANYKQFKSASHLRAATAQRLEAQRAFYEEGRILADRYLDAVSQYAAAIDQVAQFKVNYNIGLTELERAQGTLLEHHRVAVRARPGAVRSRVGHDVPTEVPPHADPGPGQIPAPPASSVGAGEFPPPGPGPAAKAIVAKPPSMGNDVGKTFSFRVTVGIGPRPVEVRGSIRIAPARSDDIPQVE